jgi:hypothetical protein
MATEKAASGLSHASLVEGSELRRAIGERYGRPAFDAMGSSFTRKGRELRRWIASMQEEYRRGAVNRGVLAPHGKGWTAGGRSRELPKP